MDFEAFPKIPRLRRECVVTEKIDGTNACIVIEPQLDGTIDFVCQSRTRIITPGKATDNYGFAEWAHANRAALTFILGFGRHYGEWWGQGIQRGYGLDRRRFSLFNVHRWDGLDGMAGAQDIGLGVVPIVTGGVFCDLVINDALDLLRMFGSSAAPGYMRPEGIVVRHSASGHLYKVLLDNDQLPKGATVPVFVDKDGSEHAYCGVPVAA